MNNAYEAGKYLMASSTGYVILILVILNILSISIAQAQPAASGNNISSRILYVLKTFILRPVTHGVLSCTITNRTRISSHVFRAYFRVKINDQTVLSGYSLVYIDGSIISTSLTRIIDEKIMRRYNVGISVQDGEIISIINSLWKNLIEKIPLRIKPVFNVTWMKGLVRLEEIISNYTSPKHLILRKTQKYKYIASQRIAPSYYLEVKLLLHRNTSSKILLIRIKHVVKAPLNARFAQNMVSIVLNASSGSLISISVNPAASNFTVKYLFTIQGIKYKVSKIISRYLQSNGYRHWRITGISVENASTTTLELHPTYELLLVYPVLQLLVNVATDKGNYTYRVYLNMETKQSWVENQSTISINNWETNIVSCGEIIVLVVLVATIMGIVLGTYKHKLEK